MLKRLFDVAGASVLLFCTFPLWLLVAIAIRLDSPGPVFYTQRRTGRFGEPFTIVKFRTMFDAPEGEVVFYASQDTPRMTRLGKRLRRYHIDELPQLVNVLTGDMSLVGPRPLPYGWLSEYRHTRSYALRICVRPGITGLMQISGRSWLNEHGFRRMVYREATYVRIQCFALDAYILWKTVGTVLGGKGV